MKEFLVCLIWFLEDCANMKSDGGLESPEGMAHMFIFKREQLRDPAKRMSS